MNKKEIFIAAYHGGLGDNLQFSTLPELYAKKGFDVYVPEGFYFRNQEICDLVWGHNPFVKGVKKGVWNAGDTPEIGHKVLNSNCISNWELLHGFKPTNKYPKVYYSPNKIENLNNTILIDLTSISTNYNAERVNKEVEKVKLSFPDKRFRTISFKKNLNPATPQSPAHNGVFKNFNCESEDRIEVQSIFQYCDLMASVAGIVTLHNGSSHLSSAIKKYNTNLISMCIIPEEQFKNNKDRAVFIFDNVEYILV